MKDVQETCRIAVIQAEPVMFDKAGGLKKALRCIRNAAAEEAELIVFPELFIPGYPIGMNFGFSMGKRTEAGRADWKRYYDASLIADMRHALNTSAYLHPYCMPAFISLSLSAGIS